MAEKTRGRILRAAGALLLVAVAARAEAAGARLRWTPSSDSRVTGYHVWMRRPGVSYGSPMNAGKPPLAADGTMSYDVSGFTAGQTYIFGVTAYTADPLESDLSVEIALGPTNPCMVDHCTTPTTCEIRSAADGSSCDDGLFCNGIAVCESGACVNGPAPNCADGVACTTDHCDEALGRCVHVGQSNCCTSDRDCADTDVCTSGERCVSGTCVSLAVSCPTSSCTDDVCDPQSGCELMPVPDGINCISTCRVLDMRRFVTRRTGDGATLIAKAQFDTSATVDPSLWGMTIEIAVGGSVAYRAAIPANEIASRKAGTKFRFIASADEPATTAGVVNVLLRQRHGVWSLTARAASADLTDVVTATQADLTVQFGDACARAANLECASDGSMGACD